MWKCLTSEVVFVENQNKPGLKRSPFLHVLSLSLWEKRERDKVKVQFAFIVHFGRADICGPMLFGSNLEAIMPDYVPQHFLLFTVSWTLTLPLFAALKRQNNNNMVRISRIWIIDAECYKITSLGRSASDHRRMCSSSISRCLSSACFVVNLFWR